MSEKYKIKLEDENQDNNDNTGNTPESGDTPTTPADPSTPETPAAPDDETPSGDGTDNGGSDDQNAKTQTILFTTNTKALEGAINSKLSSYDGKATKTPTTGSIDGDGVIIERINYSVVKIDSARFNLFKDGNDFVEIIVLKSCKMKLTPASNPLYIGQEKGVGKGTLYEKDVEAVVELTPGTWYINTNNNSAKTAKLSFEG